VTEVEVPDGMIDVSGPEGEKRLAEVLEQHQIEPQTEGKLVRRNSSQATP
jgi:hypothetical protein